MKTINVKNIQSFPSFSVCNKVPLVVTRIRSSTIFPSATDIGL